MRKNRGAVMKTIDEGIQIYQERDYSVVKANEIIQKARFNLGKLEQKTFCYIVSKIKPTDTIDTEYIFNINDYCDVCGINRNEGETIKRIKESLKRLRDSSFWLTEADGCEVLVGWLQKAKVLPKSGKVKVKLDEDMAKYLLGLCQNYTQYSLLYVLPMRSSYSIRLYELLKSYAGLKHKNFKIDELKMRLMAPYENFKDFRKKVLEKAAKEINEYTDIEVTWEPIFKGRKVVEVDFFIKTRGTWDRAIAQNHSNKVLDGQMKLNIDGSITEERR